MDLVKALPHWSFGSREFMYARHDFQHPETLSSTLALLAVAVALYPGILLCIRQQLANRRFSSGLTSYVV